MVLNDSAESTSELVNSSVWMRNFMKKQLTSILKFALHQDPKEYWSSWLDLEVLPYIEPD